MIDKDTLGNLQISEIESLNDMLEKDKEQHSTQLKSTTYKRSINIVVLGIISLVLLLAINFFMDAYFSYQLIVKNSTLLAFMYIGVYILALIGILFYVLYVIKSYMNLKNAFDIQNQTSKIEDYDDEREVALSILQHYKKHQDQEVRIIVNKLYGEVETNSLHSPFASIKKEVVDNLDKQATNQIYISAREVSIFTAFAPGSALDSLAVIFSSLKMMKKIFFIYGYRANIFTSMLITRKILENASFAALVEYTDDSVNDLLGNTLISKVSTKVAQGVGNGVLMIRIGNILVQSARPFASDGSIGSYRHMLKFFIEYVKSKIGKKK